jgi:DNA-binding PadR family transcriptional regulator
MFPMKIARLFRRGLLRYRVLGLINERPLHGYEIMKHFQDEFNGLYQPSPGSIYPILQSFDEQGHVNAEEIDGKKVYSITPQGKAFLNTLDSKFQERSEHLDTFINKRRGLHKEVRNLADLFLLNYPDLTDEQASEIETIFTETRRKISEVLFK